MAITSLDSLLSAMSTAGAGGFLSKGTFTPGTCPAYATLFYTSGICPVAGAVPGGAGESYDGTELGVIPVSANKVITQFTVSGQQTGMIMLYDRLVASDDNLVTNVTTSQTVTLPSLPRETGGQNVMAWIEVISTSGTTVSTATLTYVNQAGTGSRSATATIPSGASGNFVGNLIPFKLQEGDTGIRSASAVILSASTGGAGTFSIVLGYPIAMFGCDTLSGGGSSDHVFSNGLPIISSGAALSLFRGCTQTSTATLDTYFHLQMSSL